jgi:hypothetical protein
MPQEFVFKDLQSPLAVRLSDEKKSGLTPAPPDGSGKLLSLDGLSTPSGLPAPSLQFGIPPISIDDNPEEDVDALTNFFRTVYKDMIVGTKSSYQELKGQHVAGLRTLQEAEREYKTDDGASAFFGHTLSSIAPTALAIGAGVVGSPVLAGILAIGALGYYVLGGAGGALRDLRLYEDESGKEFSPAVESSVAVGAGLAIGASEMLGAKIIGRKFIQGMTKVALKEIGDAYRAKNLTLATKLITKEVVKSGALSAGIEAGEEGVENTINNFIESVYNPDKRTLEGLTEGLAQAMKMGAVGGLILGGAGKGLKLGVDKNDLIRMSGEYLNKETSNQLIRDIQTKMPNVSKDEAIGVTMLLVARANKMGMEVNEVLENPAVQDELFGGNARLLNNSLGEQTFPDLIQSIGHIYARTLDADEQAIANKLFKVGEGEWTEEHSKKFAESFQAYITKGKTTNKEMKGLFVDFNAWMSNVYKSAKLQDKDATMNKEVSRMFNQMLTTYEETRKDKAFENFQALQDRQAAYTEYLAMPYTYFKEGMNKIGRKLDIQYRFKDAPNTGLAAKLIHSIGKQNEVEGLRLYGDMYKSIKSQGVSRKHTIEKLNELVFLYEDDAKWNLLTVEEKEILQPAKVLLRNYMKESLKSYKTTGGLTLGFEERIMDTLHTRLAELQSKTVRGNKARIKHSERIRKIEEMIERAKGMHFLPIPINLWLNSILAHKPELGRQVLSILAAKKRQTFMIADLFDKKHGLDIKESDVRMGDILASYARKKGKDLAFLNLREALIEDGIAVKKKRDKNGKVNKHWTKTMNNAGFVNTPIYTPFLYDYMVKNDFFQYLDGITRRADNLGIPSKILNITKMTQFYNPLFLPMYDIIQGVMLGSTTGLTARMLTGAGVGAKVGAVGGVVGGALGGFIGGGIGLISDKRFRSAIRSVVTKDAKYQGAVSNGLTSTPYPNPLQNYQEQMNTMASGTPELRNLITNFATVNPVKIFKAVYTLSWNTAWQLDGIIRMYSYNYLIDKKGLSPEKAAQRAALFHGDYAGVPARTRNQMNRLFFTPTFKVAMGKLYINMIHGFGQTIAPTIKTSADAKNNFYAVLRMVAMLGAWDMLMMSLGYDRDQFGRRYVKEVETEEGKKESVLTFSAPHNMFLKYAYRANEAFGPEVDNAMMQLVKSNSWEIHPLYRVSFAIASNEKSDGSPIYGHLEPYEGKLMKMTAYMIKGLLPILKIYGGEVESADAREQLKKEIGQTSELLTRYFTFTYLRMPKEVRMSNSIQRLKAFFHEDINNVYKDIGEVPNAVLEERYKELLKKVNKILKSYNVDMYGELDELD